MAVHQPSTPQLPIVVGIDGSEAAIQAAEWAVDEAFSRDVPLRLVEVMPQQAEPAPLASVGNLAMEREYGQTALRIALHFIERIARSEKVRVEVVATICGKGSITDLVRFLERATH